MKATERIMVAAFEMIFGEISEDQWCAAWLIGIEHYVWEMYLVGRGAGEHQPTLSDLVEATGAWLYKPGALMPLDEWKKRHEAWKTRGAR